MEDWQQRVVEEKKELNEKIMKLVTFLFTSTFEISENARKLLEMQRDVMLKYSDILTARIEDFGPKNLN